MSVRDELHQLVNQLADDDADEALAYLRDLMRGTPASHTGRDVMSYQSAPRVVSGQAFFASPHVDLETLSAEQGIGPVTSIDELIGDFWPEDEGIDEFVATIREWRSEGAHG